MSRSRRTCAVNHSLSPLTLLAAPMPGPPANPNTGSARGVAVSAGTTTTLSTMRRPAAAARSSKTAWRPHKTGWSDFGTTQGVSSSERGRPSSRAVAHDTAAAEIMAQSTRRHRSSGLSALRAAQHAPGQRAGVIAAVDDDVAVHDHRRHTDRTLVRRIVGRAVGDSLGIEDRDVGPGAL